MQYLNHGLGWTLILCTGLLPLSLSFSMPRPTAHNIVSSSSSSSSAALPAVGNILILDHLNINHEQGRHDWLKAFYFDFLQCAIDPRKQENLVSGKKTVWANIGAQQFHLPEGKPHAQVLDGIVTLVYNDLSRLRERYEAVQQKLQHSQFLMTAASDGTSLDVTDPWGNSFRIVQGDESERDDRGTQPGGASEGLAMRDLTIYTSPTANMAGIARFYKHVLGAPIVESSAQGVMVSVGPRQTLSFTPHPQQKLVGHVDLVDQHIESPKGYPPYLSNYGPHVSMYVADLPGTYQRVQELGALYVNPRFKRQAYTLDQAIDDCMFRCLDIVDPEDVNAGAILRLEHEIRSVVTRDGSKYKSCPFDEVPEVCKRPMI